MSTGGCQWQRSLPLCGDSWHHSSQVTGWCRERDITTNGKDKDNVWDDAHTHVYTHTFCYKLCPLNSVTLSLSLLMHVWLCPVWTEPDGAKQSHWDGQYTQLSFTILQRPIQEMHDITPLHYTTDLCMESSRWVFRKIYTVWGLMRVLHHLHPGNNV